MIMHQMVLDFMLANTCHHEKLEDGIVKFTFDLHCYEVEVIARFAGDWEKDDVRYEIVSWSNRPI